MNKRLFVSLALALVIFSSSGMILAFPYIVDAQSGGSSILSGNSGCPAGTTARAIPGTFGRYECLDQAGSVVGNSDFIGYTSATVSCSATSWWTNFGTCLGRQIAAWTGAGLIWLTSLLLGIAGSIFNWLIENTVVNFDAVIYSTVATGVQTAWGAFRDLANIVIIGIFTFVAIEMILGTQTFGGKRTVAKVLIVAILINFSLLFARIIVESSNFVARQFYQAVQLQSGTATGGAASTNPYAAGISGRFAQMMGVVGVQESSDALFKTAEKNKNGWIALGQGVLTAAVFLAAAAAFIYAAFLMVVRAVLLIFLIMTSSLAFSAWLVPTSFTGGYSFEGWWKALLKNSLFGPLLLIMLWATLMVGEDLSRIPGSGQIGGLLNNPADPGGVGALFGYLIILGMLVVSIKVASSFSKEIGGFNYASMATKLAGGVPLAIGARALGFAGRQYIGRRYAAEGEKLGKEEGKIKGLIARVPDGRNFDKRRQFLNDKLEDVQKKKDFADKLAGSKFSLANTEFGKKLLTKQLGVPDAIAGGGKNVVSYGDQMKKVAEESAKRGVEVAKMSKGDQDDLRKSATAVLEQQRELVSTQIQSARTTAEAEKNARAAELQQMEGEKTAGEAALRNAEQNMPPGQGRDATLDREKMRIQQAQESINKWHKQIEKNAGVEDLSKRMESLEDQIKKTGDAAVNAGKDRLRDAGERVAMNTALGRTVNVRQPLGKKAEDDQTARMARSAYRKKVGDSGEEDRILNALRQRLNSSSPPSQTPPTNPSP